MTQSASISSNLLSVTIKRWLSLFLCSVTASILIFSLSELKWLQEAFSAYSKIITANIWVYHASAFIAGIAIKVLLDRFRITHPKRIFRPNFSYPPITISIWLTILIISCFTIFSKDDSKELIFLMFESKALSQICLIISGICISHLTTSNKFSFSLITLTFISILFIALKPNNYLASDLVVYCYSAMLILFIFLEKRLIKADSNFVSSTNETSKKEVENFRSKEEFQRWFKDDTPINTIEQLEPDYQVYANRIYDRLINKGIETEELAQQIALYGPFGCGKSSIIASIVNELKKNKSENTNKRNWLHCDISTWGIQADHVAQVVLIHVIDTIAEKLDMCAFRSLPKHYVEAMKGGGSHWQIMAALLNKTTDVETCLAELNSVLLTTNINLLITIQDIDRGTPDDKTRRRNELVALLDHLKNRIFNKVNFIIAMGYEGHDQVDIISKVTDTTEYILKINYQSIISKWHTLNFEEIFNQGLHLTEKPFINSIEEYNAGQGLSHSVKYRLLNKHIIASNQLIHSIRIMKKIMRRVDSSWTKEKLLGEVDLDTLLLTFTLRETEPDLFNALIKIYPDLFHSPNALQKKARGEDTGISVSTRINEITTNTIKLLNKSQQFYINLVCIILDIEDLSKENGQTIQVNFEQYKATQTLRNQLNYTNYLNRLLLEDIPNNELRDQDVLKTFKAFEESTEEQKRTTTENILSDNRWLEAYERFDHVMFNSKNKVVHQKTFFNQLVYLSKNNAELSNKLNNKWFIDIALTLIKNGFFEQVFNEFINTKQFLLIKEIANKISLNPSAYISTLDSNHLINSLKGTWEIFIDEFSEIISDFMVSYSKVTKNNSEDISTDLLFLFEIFSNTPSEKLEKAIEYINKIKTNYLNDKIIYIKTIKKIKNESIENNSKTWDYWINGLKRKKEHSLNKNDNKVNFLDFILKEMEKIEQEFLE